MGQMNPSRIEIREGAYSFNASDLASMLLELDQRLNGSNVYLSLTRDGDNLISGVTYYSDAARTLKIMARQITRVVTTGGVKRISNIVNIFYQEDGVTEDSRVTNAITRGSDLINSDNGPFTTAENQEP
jgi:hypothetical protein